MFHCHMPFSLRERPFVTNKGKKLSELCSAHSYLNSYTLRASSSTADLVA
uniref:Uncharacterized protein n=1 Tax=Octopus bimaculoides TaxID=37653 RepID=A0A0L8HVV9_OCTBM